MFLLLFFLLLFKQENVLIALLYISHILRPTYRPPHPVFFTGTYGFRLTRAHLKFKIVHVATTNFLPLFSASSAKKHKGGGGGSVAAISRHIHFGHYTANKSDKTYVYRLLEAEHLLIYVCLFVRRHVWRSKVSAMCVSLTRLTFSSKCKSVKLFSEP